MVTAQIVITRYLDETGGDQIEFAFPGRDEVGLIELLGMLRLAEMTLTDERLSGEDAEEDE